MADTIKTLDDIINTTSKYDMNNITYYTATGDSSLIIPDTDVFSIYSRFINTYVGSYSVTPKQRERYRYRPDILSRDVYGTPRLDWLIMRLNDRECPSEFKLKTTVKLIPTTALDSLYDSIVTKSTQALTENWNTYLPMTET